MFGENKKDIVASVFKGSKAIISEETHLLRAGGFLLDLRVEGGHSLRALTHQVEATLQGRRRAHTSNQSDTQQHVKGTSQGSSSTVTAPRGRVKSAHAPRPRPPWKRGLTVHRASRIPCCPPAREAVALLKGDGSRGSTRVPQAAPGADRLGREAPMLQAEPSTDSPLWTAVCRRPPIFAPRLREICLLFRFWYQACRHGGAQMHVRARICRHGRAGTVAHAHTPGPSGHLPEVPEPAPAAPGAPPGLASPHPPLPPADLACPQATGEAGPRSSTKWIVPALVSGLFSMLQVPELRAHLPSQTGPRGDGCWRAARRLGDTEKHQTTHIEAGSSSLILCLLSDCILQMKGSLPRKDSLPQSDS